MAFSSEVFVGADGPRTMRFLDNIRKHQVLILVDSGSSHSFLSSHIADNLVGVQLLSSSVKVQVANGGIMQCSSHLPASAWTIQGHSFTTDLRVLPLQHFDLILGMTGSSPSVQ